MKKTILSSVLLAGLLVACGSDPIVTDMDILVAKNNHSLSKLYQRLQSDKKVAKPSSDWAESVRINLDKVGREIALEKEQKVLASLQGEKAIYDPAELMARHDIATLEQAFERSSGIEPYNKEIYLGLIRQIEKAINNKKIEVRVRQADFDRLSDREALKKIAVLDEIAELSGGDVAAEIQLQKTAYIDGLFAQAEAALKSKKHEVVLMHLTNLEQIDADYPGLDTLRNSLYAEEFEQQFWDALGDGDTDLAYELFYKLSKIPVYMENNHSIKPIAEDIAQYFLVAGKSSMDNFNMAEAYQAYSRARYIRNLLGQEEKYDDGEKAFIEQLVTRIHYFMDNDQSMHAYGYLSVLDEIQPNHPLLVELTPTVNEKILSEAVVKIVQQPFMGKKNDYQFDALLNKALAAAIKAELPTRVQLLAGQDKANYTAEKVKSLSNVAGFYSFSAEILAITLETQSVEESEITNVLVSHQRIENPDYIQWQNLSKRAKKVTPEPEPTISKPIKQDVEIKHVHHKKLAESSVTYRINEIASADVVISDALNDVVDHAVTTTAAVDQGEFKLAAVVVQLPADTQVLQELADKVAKSISAKLVVSIDKMEDEYTEKAKLAYVAKNYSVAAANFAYRNVLYQAQGKANEDILSGLRKSAMNWQ
ncbi:MAG: hypothetical protein HRU20_06885 [Pseudomonadales bacterium]|nr:hypothetical protein [Pseudomonadales bacterium]